MSASTENHRLSSAGRGAASGWIVPAVVSTALFALLGVLFYDIFASMVSTWARSATYAHGFVIVPLVLWLLWRRRDAARVANIRPDWRALVLLALLGFGWLLGHISAVLIVQQYAVVAMIPTLVWLLAGPDLARVWRFPLLFLLLAVPVGSHFLVPALIDFTADWTVILLRLTGIPVFRQGNHFVLPSGSWSVIAACSGLRYLIASFTLGCLYAYLSYRHLWRRLAFVAASIVVPIVANALRAYLIVLIGHLIGMRFATGIDHIIYGWIFFGFVMLLLFWIGGFWREPPSPALLGRGQHDAKSQRTPHRRVLVAALAGAIIITAWPVYAWLGNLTTLQITGPPLTLPTTLVGWTTGEPFTKWRPSYENVTDTAVRIYEGPSGPVGLYIGLYRDQHEGAELIAWENGLVDTGFPSQHPWHVVSQSQETVKLADGATLSVPLTVLTDHHHQKLAVWHWYWTSGTMTSSDIVVKLLTTKSRLLHQSDAAAMVAVYVPLTYGEPLPRTDIAAFIQEALPVVTARLKATTTLETAQ